MPEPRFPNIERLICSIYAPLVGGDEHVGNETPEDLEDVLPFIRVTRTGGIRTHQLDFPTFDVSYFDVDERAGEPRVTAWVDLLLSRPPPHPALDLVDCTIAPRELPWSNDLVRHWGASFAAETRRVRPAS